MPATLGQLALGGAELPDLLVGDLERVEQLGLGDLVRARLDHQERVVGAGHDQVELGLGDLGLVGVDHELALELADAHRAHLGRERDVGQGQRGGGAVHREDVVGMHVVDAHRRRDDLRLAVPALREQRPDRPVDHARGEDALLGGAALALEEAAGDLPGGVHALLDVHGQGQEVHVAHVAGGRGAEHHVSPVVTTTEPPACLASLPVSKLISVPAMSTEARSTA